MAAIIKDPGADYKLTKHSKVELMVYADEQRNELLKPDQNFPGISFCFELIVSEPVVSKPAASDPVITPVKSTTWSTKQKGALGLSVLAMLGVLGITYRLFF